MSREAVIRRIVEREEERLPLTEERVAKQEPELFRAAVEAFGAWITALRYAGITLRRGGLPRDYTPEEVLRKARELCWKGYSPTAIRVRRFDYRLHRAGIRHFGSWKGALAAAGIDLRKACLGRRKPRRLDRDQVTIALQKWAMAGHSIRWGDVCLENRGLAIAGRSVFGTWRKALLAAGLLHVVSQPSAKPKRRWDRQKVMDAICLRRREGRPVNYQGVKQEDSGLLWAGRRYFGTWAKAVAAANEGYSAGADR